MKEINVINGPEMQGTVRQNICISIQFACYIYLSSLLIAFEPLPWPFPLQFCAAWFQITYHKLGSDESAMQAKDMRL